MYSIGKLSKMFNLSRSTLLYYNSIGLLEPSARTKSNYRIYSQDDANRLKKICLYRETGMSLENIKRILDSCGDIYKDELEKQLEVLNTSKKKLELQQRIIVQMLTEKNEKTPSLPNNGNLLDLIKDAVEDDSKLIKLHADLEKISPAEHLAFLRFLHIPESEIYQIIEYSKKINAE